MRGRPWLLVLALIGILAGCAAGGAVPAPTGASAADLGSAAAGPSTSAPGPTAPGSTGLAPAAVLPTGVAPEIVRSVEQAMSTFNATAGGPVAGQQAALNRLVSPGQTQVQSRCATPSGTISFEPVYARLAPAPEWNPAAGTLPGTIYQLPTLIRIYSGDRIIGTDLTDLHVAIDAGQARFPALCLN